jgi:hypothetical protein
VITIPPDQLTAYDVLGADVVLFTDATLPGENTEGAARPARRTRRTPAAAVTSDDATELEGESEVASAVDEPPAEVSEVDDSTTASIAVEAIETENAEPEVAEPEAAEPVTAELEDSEPEVAEPDETEEEK